MYIYYIIISHEVVEIKPEGNLIRYYDCLMISVVASLRARRPYYTQKELKIGNVTIKRISNKSALKLAVICYSSFLFFFVLSN